MSFSAAMARLNSATLRTFAEAVVVRPGYPSFVGVFDHRTTEIDALSDMPGDGRGMFSGPVPVLTVDDVHAAGLRPDDALTVSSVKYTVRDLQPDGQGFTLITLRLA
jgi:hypothetical protein